VKKEGSEGQGPGPTIVNSTPTNKMDVYGDQPLEIIFQTTTSAPSLPTFRQRLKNFLFPITFPDIILDNSHSTTLNFITVSRS